LKSFSNKNDNPNLLISHVFHTKMLLVNGSVHNKKYEVRLS
jgi:hypothetical protein